MNIDYSTFLLNDDMALGTQPQRRQRGMVRHPGGCILRLMASTWTQIEPSPEDPPGPPTWTRNESELWAGPAAYLPLLVPLEATGEMHDFPGDYS